MTNQTRTAEAVDILLLLEGTYPYVAGGVSTWVHQLITLFPDYTFGVIFLGGQRSDYQGIKYELPANLIHLETHYLFDPLESQPGDPSPTVDTDAFNGLTCLHDQFHRKNHANYQTITQDILSHFQAKTAITLSAFLKSEPSFDYTTAKYQEKCPRTSFLDYFWSVRNMHIPLWRIINLIQQAPKARCLHSVSTGYAGFLGALLAEKSKTPFVLTEHGIYIKERKIDLMQHQWLNQSYFNDVRDQRSKQYLTDLWIKFFETLGHFCYDAASTIISLFEAYHQQQIHYGANPQKTKIIANGVNTDETLLTAKTSPNQINPIVALIGRVVPIKDIKNFIRSMVVLLKTYPEAVGWIVGPTDEDDIYYTECKELITALDLNEKIIFKGRQSIPDILKTIDILVLSSISEGLPLVVLEAFAAGVPVVSTDVGACKELIIGTTEEDLNLGQAGVIVAISDSSQLAEGMVQLLSNSTRWQAAQQAARTRVTRYYSQARFQQNYQLVYEEALSSWQA